MQALNNRPANVLPVPKWTVIIHSVQMVLAVVILGLDAYGIRWIAYNALIFSLVAAILTLGVCIYIVGTSLFLHKLYNMYIVLALHLLMVVFWIVDMGLVANLARIWAGPQCSYSYYYDSYYCSYGKRDLMHFDKRETTTVKNYYGALAAGAFFGSVQFATWVLSTVFTVIYINKHRSNPNAAYHAPPAYSGGDQAVPLEQKYAQTAPAQPVYQQTPQPQPPQPVPQGQFVQQPVYNQQPQYTGQYPQDPINREQTVSPVSQAGYASPPQQPMNYNPHPNATELGANQNPVGYNPNVSELSNQK